MILINKRNLKFLQAGREITITTQSTRQYRHGRSYAAGVRPNHTVLRVLVVRATPGEDGVRLTIRASQEDEIRLLGKNGGYVSDPSQALREEPEAVDEASQEKFAAVGTLNWARHNLERENERLARTLAVRLRDAQRRGDLDELRRVKREIDRLERQMMEQAA